MELKDFYMAKKTMTLKEWLAKEGMTQTAFSEKTGLVLQSVSRYVNGRIPDDKDTMRIIYDNTKREVTPNNFYGLG